MSRLAKSRLLGRIASQPGRPPSRLDALFLLALLLFVGVWHVWALSSDQRFRLSTDNYSIHALGSIEVAKSLFQAKDGPVAACLTIPLLLLLPPGGLALRLASVLCHIVLITICFALAYRIFSSINAGHWTALLCALYPPLFGLMRLSYYDNVAAVFLLGSLLLMLHVKLEKPGPALLLGIFLGLGFLVKYSFSVNIVAPLIWFVIDRVRTRRNLLYLLLVLSSALVLFLPWLFHGRDTITQDVFLTLISTWFWSSLLNKGAYYLGLPGVAPLFIACAISGAVLWFFRRERRWEICLLFSFVPMLAVNVIVPPHWGRFLSPILPLSATVTGGGIDELLRRMGPRGRTLLSTVFACSVILLFVALNLSWMQTGQRLFRRECYAGILAPDTRSYNGYRAAMSHFARTGAKTFLLGFDGMETRLCAMEEVLIQRYSFSSNLRRQDLHEARAQLAEGQEVSFLLVSTMEIRAPRGENRISFRPADESPEIRWLLLQDRVRLLAVYVDPDGIRYNLLRVQP